MRLPYNPLTRGAMVTAVVVFGALLVVLIGGWAADWLAVHLGQQRWVENLRLQVAAVAPVGDSVHGAFIRNTELLARVGLTVWPLLLMVCFGFFMVLLAVFILRLNFVLNTREGQLNDKLDELREAQVQWRKADKKYQDTREQAAKMHERISDGFLLVNGAHELLYLNNRARRFCEEVLDYHQEFEGTDLDSIIPAYQETGLAKAIKQALDNNRPNKFEAQLRADVWIAGSIYPTATGLYVYFQDISRQKSVKVKVKASISLLRQLIDSAPTALAITDMNWSYLAANRQWGGRFKLENEQILGQYHGTVLPDSIGNLQEVAAQIQQGEIIQTAEKPYKIGDTEEWISWQVRPWWDDDDHMSGFIITADFTTEQRRNRAQVERMREQERRLAYHDALTGLPNRQLFYDRLNQALAHAYRNMNKVALMFLDLDGFKAINDTLGHDAGDLLLKEVSRRLQNCVRNTDTVARLGGDEFTVILNGVHGTEDATQVADKIIKSINQPYDLAGKKAQVSTSIGISLYPTDGSSSVDLIKRADTAMYQAKNSGKNQYRLFAQPDVANVLKSGENTESQIHQAIENNEFELHYQPQVKGLSKEVIGVEALLRWRHPEHGLLEPGRFLQAAEESGAIFELGEWVLHEACRQNMEWRKAGHPELRMSVNLSARQFRDQRLIGCIRDVLEQTGMPASALGLEMTEAILMENAKTTMDTLNELKIMGLELIIDDFGTSFTSMSRLKNFPVDTLKIHQSFIHNLGESDEDKAIIKTIITLAENLHLHVIGEGVESRSQADFLLDNGCPVIQGYLYGRPVRPSKAAEFLSGKIEESATAND